MKKNMILGGLVVLALVQTATATIVVSQDWSVNQALPDGNPAGLAVSQTFSGLYEGVANAGIDNVAVNLTISGGYNGDLYGYLTLQNANGTYTAILLNRVGRNDASGFGSAASGFDNITLVGAGVYQNIHDATPVSGGTYLADGRAVNPNGNTGVSPTAGLEMLNNQSANGTWTLFLADMAGGDRSTLVSWGLDISVVPEPTMWALIGFGGVAGAVGLLRRRFAAGVGKIAG